MRCTCAVCDISFASIKDYQKHNCEKEQPKMTREEAVKKIGNIIGGHKYLDVLEALGLLEFDERKKHEVKHILSVDVDQFEPKMHIGVANLELWPEGLVLWVGGKIRWKSWEVYYKVGEQVVIRNTNSDSVLGYIK